MTYHDNYGAAISKCWPTVISTQRISTSYLHHLTCKDDYYVHIDVLAAGSPPPASVRHRQAQLTARRDITQQEHLTD